MHGKLNIHVCIHINQVVEKELLIQEKEKLYMELKTILQRQPGPEVAEQLQIYQQTLKEKTKQMKVKVLSPTSIRLWYTSLAQSMASELNMYESQVSEYRMDIDRLQRRCKKSRRSISCKKKGTIFEVYYASLLSSV